MKFATSKMTVDGKTVEVRELSARNRQELFKLNKADTDPIEIQANIIKMGCTQFNDADIDDILDIPGGAFDKISQKVLEMSGLADKSDEDAAKN